MTGEGALCTGDLDGPGCEMDAEGAAEDACFTPLWSDHHWYLTSHRSQSSVNFIRSLPRASRPVVVLCNLDAGWRSGGLKGISGDVM
jgi:hypothetical protein